MTTSSSSPRRRHPDRWRRRGTIRPLIAVAVAVLIIVVLIILDRWGDGYRAGHPVEALVDATSPGPATPLRVVLLVATAVTGGVGLVRPVLGASAPVPRGVRLVAWVGGLVAAVTCVAAVLTGLASRPLGAAQLVVSVAVPLLLAGTWLVVPASALLVGLLAVVLSGGRDGLPLALDVSYAVAGSVLLGASVLGVALFRRDGLPRARLTGIAVGAGLPASVAGVGQLLLTGPRGRYDLLHTGYGLASLAQAALPVLATAAWLLAGRVAGRPRAAGLTRPAADLARVAAGSVALAFAAAAMLGTLPPPAAAPAPGRPLLRPVDLPLRRLTVQVMPMRPGPNLVHIGSAGPGGRRLPDHHGAPPAEEPSGALTVSAGGAAVPVTGRPATSGGWAVLTIPPGTTELTVTGDGVPATVPIDVGTDPAPEQLVQALTGPDGPECASAALGTLSAPPSARDGVAPPRSDANDTASSADVCPSQELTASDAEALRDTVAFLASREITGLHLVADDSPRAVAADELVRAEAAKVGLPISTAPIPGDTVLAVSGWSRGAEAVREAAQRAAGAATGGLVVAPWLLTGGVLGQASSEVLPLAFNPQEIDARRYAGTVATVFPGERPSYAGYLSWARRTGAVLDPRVSFYGAAPVDVPMGVDMSHGGDPAGWYPDGTVVLINPPLGTTAGNP